MILRGIIDRSLGGFVCIRGYAQMGDLANISHADLDYQRDLITTHRETVIRFLSNRQNLFFPEVILSCVLEYDFNMPRAVSGLRPISDVLEGKKFTSNVNGITVSSKATSYKTAGDSRAPRSIRVATLEIPDELVEGNSTALFRIDGNHRLSAVDKESKFRDIVAPYCVILFDSGAEDRRNSKTIFHNINSKSIPLTPEENLKIILDDTTLFPDDLLRDSESFGWSFYLARKTLPEIEPKAVPALKEVLQHPRTILVELFELLIRKKVIRQSAARLGELRSCLQTVHDIYSKDDDLRQNRCVGLFHAFVFFCITDDRDGRFKPFCHWVEGNHLAAMKATDADSIIEIFTNVFTAKARTVFISMQFGKETDATYKTITRTVERINQDCRPKIKIEPLRIDELNEGHSYAITDEILKAIETTGLLIADLTHGNKNVYHEVGYLMGLNRAWNRGQDNFVLIVRNRSSEQVAKDVGFNLKGISQIRFEEMNELEEELAKTIKKYYGLA